MCLRFIAGNNYAVSTFGCHSPLTQCKYSQMAQGGVGGRKTINSVSFQIGECDYKGDIRDPLTWSLYAPSRTARDRLTVSMF